MFHKAHCNPFQEREEQGNELFSLHDHSSSSLEQINLLRHLQKIVVAQYQTLVEKCIVQNGPSNSSSIWDPIKTNKVHKIIIKFPTFSQRPLL